MSVTLNRARHPKLKRTLRSIARNWDLYLLLVPVLAYFIIFHYAPMYGVQIAFRRYSIRKGILGSQWVGMAHFNRFFQSYYFERLLVNTLTISLYNLALGFPLPILLALLLNKVTRSAIRNLCRPSPTLRTFSPPWYWSASSTPCSPPPRASSTT